MRTLTRKEWEERCLVLCGLNDGTVTKVFSLDKLWVPVTEALPEEGARVLFINDGFLKCGEFFIADGTDEDYKNGYIGFNSNEYGMEYKVTQWTYLLLPEED